MALARLAHPQAAVGALAVGGAVTGIKAPPSSRQSAVRIARPQPLTLRFALPQLGKIIGRSALALKHRIGSHSLKKSLQGSALRGRPPCD